LKNGGCYVVEFFLKLVSKLDRTFLGANWYVTDTFTATKQAELGAPPSGAPGNFIKNIR